MDNIDFDYHAYGSAKPKRILTCATAVALSFGSHASVQALAPAESALTSLGVSPLGYAALTVAPIALGLVSPLMWGRLWDANNGLACILAPTGELVGTMLLAAGLYMYSVGGSDGLVARVLLVLGFLFISAFKAGVAIAEFSTVGRACGKHSAVGFSCVILSKHAMGILIAWGVPRVLATTTDDVLGIARVQLALLLPHVVSMMAGIRLAQMRAVERGLACDEDDTHEKEDRVPREERVPITPLSTTLIGSPTTPPPGMLADAPSATSSPVVGSPAVALALSRVSSLLGLSEKLGEGERSPSFRSGPGGMSVPRSIYAVTIIGLWRALAVGTLHAYHSIRIKFMQSRGLALTEAGPCL